MITENQLKRALKLQGRIKDIQSDMRKIEDMAMTVANGVIKTDVLFSMTDITKPEKKQPKIPSMEELFRKAITSGEKEVHIFSMDDFEPEEEFTEWGLTFNGTEFLTVLQAMLTYKNKRLEQWTKELAKIIKE